MKIRLPLGNASVTDRGSRRIPRLGWCAYARRAGRPRRWGGSTPKACATFLAVLLQTGAPRSAFLAVVVETPAAAETDDHGNLGMDSEFLGTETVEFGGFEVEGEFLFFDEGVFGDNDDD